jgi:hypothetical protein
MLVKPALWESIGRQGFCNRCAGIKAQVALWFLCMCVIFARCLDTCRRYAGIKSRDALWFVCMCVIFCWLS